MNFEITAAGKQALQAVQTPEILNSSNHIFSVNTGEKTALNLITLDDVAFLTEHRGAKEKVKAS